MAIQVAALVGKAAAGQAAARGAESASKKLGAAAAGVLAAFLLVVLVPLALLGGGGGAAINVGGVPADARPFVQIYEDAADVYDVNPFLLMAVHEDETSFGTSTAPGVRDGVNFAGCCAGPMQFYIAGGASNTIGGHGATWGGYATAYQSAKLSRPSSYPNQYAPHPNVYDSYDAIYAGAKYFKAMGAGPELDERTRQALIGYKGTPPASIPFAEADYARAKELQQLASAPMAMGGGTATGSPKHIIDTVVIPIARQNGIQITVASNDGANARHGTTVSGNRSDHQGPPEFAWASDMSNGYSPTPQMDSLARDLATQFDIPWSGSGAVSTTTGGYRFQMIYRSNVGGNHYNHVHFGIKKVG